MTIKPTNAVEAVPHLVELLANLPPDEQKRAVSAAMILLGQSGPSQPDQAIDGVSSKAVTWMKKYSLTEEQLNHVFSIAPDEVDVIASNMPGDSKRQQTAEAYLICGLKSLIRTGDARFEDKDARELCQKLGCYDGPNHSNYMKAFGNLLSGSKEIGWKVTNPGFDRVAQVVKLLADASTV